MSDPKYVFFRRIGIYSYKLSSTSSDPYNDDIVKQYDAMLHRALSEIFHKRRLTSDQIRKLVSVPKKRTYKKSIFQLILEQEPALGQLPLQKSKLSLLPTRNQFSLLWIAVLSCYQDSAELLVKSGADVNELYGLLTPTWYEINKKSTILHALLLMFPSSWNERFIGLVIDHGADLEARDLNDSTVLHVAVRQGRVKLVERLLEKGADVNAGDYDGVTPLLEAARGKNADELIPLLMAHGADVNAKDDDGKNVLHHFASAPVEHTDQARILLERGVSLQERESNHDFQPLHSVASHGKNKLVNLYLDHGADVNAQGHNDASPLYAAALYCDNPAVLLTLLQRGANIDQKDYLGWNALHMACHLTRYTSFRNIEGIIKILLSAGADMFAETQDGSTPFDLIVSEDIKDTLMIKTMALRMACQQPGNELTNPMRRKYYEDCVEVINRMKATRFIESCTMFELLTKCQCQIAPLMRNPEFESKFRLFDLGIFSMYAADIVENYERAERYCQAMLKQEEIINERFYHRMPDVIVRKVIRYIFNNCEICELKRIVQASRRPPNDGSDNQN